MLKKFLLTIKFLVFYLKSLSMDKVPHSFVMAKEKLENKVKEDLDVDITSTGKLVVRNRNEKGEVMDYIEFNPDNNKWAWESNRDLPVTEDSGVFKVDAPTAITEKVKKYLTE